MSVSRFLGIALGMMMLAGCGMTPQLASTTTSTSSAQSDLSGVYLALTYVPTPEVGAVASKVRADLQFVDMHLAVPPRDTDELHVTVGYFKRLTGHDAEAIAEQFRNHDAEIQVTGYGTVNNQVAFFTVDGITAARGVLQNLKVAFSGDDPHSTFGVNPANPHDINGVPKHAQKPLGPFHLKAQYHLMQGNRKLW